VKKIQYAPQQTPVVKLELENTGLILLLLGSPMAVAGRLILAGQERLCDG
jgi:hypothetical protein